MKGSSTRQLGVVRRKGKKKSNPMDNVIAAKAWDLYFLEYGSPYGSHVHQKCTPAMHQCNRAISLYHECLPSLCLENHDAVMREGVREREEKRRGAGEQ